MIVTHYIAGRLCEIDIDECVGDPCQHDGTCDDQQNGFTCRCLPGYAGKLCSEIAASANNDTNSTIVVDSTLDDQNDPLLPVTIVYNYSYHRRQRQVLYHSVLVVKFSHTCCRALGPELIPAYRQLAYR